MRLSLLLLATAAMAAAAPLTVSLRLTDGTTLEGTTSARSIGPIALGGVLSIHNAAPATAAEAKRIQSDLAVVQADKDRKGRDRAVEELTAIGLPVLTPLLDLYKDTDQHEPRPLYRLFERIVPSRADGFDRALSLVRLKNGTMQRVALTEATLPVRTADGQTRQVSVAQIRTLAVRQKSVTKTAQVHTLKHCTQIEYLDSGLQLTSGSKLTTAAVGFGRLSWATDSWASDPNGITKPGSPAYKSHLVDGHPFGALVGRTGAGGENFFLGRAATKTGLAPGRLYLAVNDNRHWQNNLGTYTVTLTATDAYDLGDAQ